MHVHPTTTCTGLDGRPARTARALTIGSHAATVVRSRCRVRSSTPPCSADTWAAYDNTPPGESARGEASRRMRRPNIRDLCTFLLRCPARLAQNCMAGTIASPADAWGGAHTVSPTVLGCRRDTTTKAPCFECLTGNMALAAREPSSGDTPAPILRNSGNTRLNDAEPCGTNPEFGRGQEGG